MPEWEATEYSVLNGVYTEKNTRHLSQRHRHQDLRQQHRDSVYMTANSDYDYAQMAAGQALVSVMHISVHWQWLALPALVWVLVALVLMGTWWKTRRTRMPKWHNDPLPLLFLYREEMKRESEGGLRAQVDASKLDKLGVTLYASEQRINGIYYYSC
ncbi:hypothetical protein BO78DRAFT_88345 [Aspergillus sclerotiicarbonarius CBS 121057]|uniref:Uncharacterized protein n=1 Tax=Aspergillus sclerotiicarbonarius (strain CBS 121057 / IBT 28362) TaxID=1448318 RepID=A0A319ELX2_ASPSB|nr:hypothetical protein BO78DRAFT_88345 [Aspergillus sclerotiicarbonarius CBS 121057]